MHIQYIILSPHAFDPKKLPTKFPYFTAIWQYDFQITVTMPFEHNVSYNNIVSFCNVYVTDYAVLLLTDLYFFTTRPLWAFYLMKNQIACDLTWLRPSLLQQAEHYVFIFDTLDI